MKFRAFALVVVAALSPISAARSADLSPEAVADYLAAHGPQETVGMLTAAKDRTRWRSVLHGVARGDARWLALVEDLSAGTDAGASEALQVSIATALPKNPAGVLRLVRDDGPLSVAQLCSAPFIEPTRAFLLRYLRQARTALRRLDDRRVEARRVACLQVVQSTLAEQTAASRP